MARASPDVCLNDDELTTLLRGQALGDERQQFMLHLDRCSGCRSLLAEAARHLESVDTRTRARLRVALFAAAVLITLVTLWMLRSS